MSANRRLQIFLGILMFAATQLVPLQAQESVSTTRTQTVGGGSVFPSPNGPASASSLLLVQAQDTQDVPGPPPAPSLLPDGPQPLVDNSNNMASLNPRPRPSRRSVRIARAPNMFGDFFGTAKGSLIANVTGPGSLNGLLGEMNFPAFASSGGNAFLILDSTPGIGLIPGVASFTETTGNSFFITTDNPVPPASTFPLSATDQVTIDALLNSPTARAQYLAEIATIEAQNTGGTLVDANLAAQAQGVVSNTQGGQFDFEAIFPFILSTTVQRQAIIDVPTPATGGAVVGRLKIAENSSAVPQDRVFFNYSYFDNVAMTSDGVPVNRFVPGFEKTFFDKNASIEVRVPMATTLSSDIDLNGVTNSGQNEMGNLWLTAKAVLTETEDTLLSAGLTVTVPTADDLNFRFGNTDFIRVNNDSVHLMPFLGALHTPNDRFFAMGFLQFDFDTNGNPVLMNTTGQGLERVGRINDVPFVFVDASVGYWLYRANSSSRSFITGIAPTVELHYNRSLSSTDVLTVGNSQVGNFSDSIELLNGVIGTTFQLGPNRTLGLAYATPIGGGADQQFDGELRATLNWFFGGSR